MKGKVYNIELNERSFFVVKLSSNKVTKVEIYHRNLTQIACKCSHIKAFAATVTYTHSFGLNVPKMPQRNYKSIKISSSVFCPIDCE